MKKILFTLALLVSFVSFGQKFNGNTHIVVEDIEYKDGSMDKYDLIPKIIKFFKKKGFRNDYPSLFSNEGSFAFFWSTSQPQEL